MIDIVERKPLPRVCRNCQEVKEYGVDAACYNCENALKRFKLVKEEISDMDKHKSNANEFYIQIQIDNIRRKEDWHRVMGMIEFASQFNMISFNQSVKLQEAADNKLCLLDASI